MDANQTNPLYTDPQQQVLNTLEFNEVTIQISDPLAMDIDDVELEKIVTDRINTSKKFFEEKYNLTERRQKNERYLFGRQVAEKEKKGEIKDYETRSADNALYEIEASLKPLAMSKLPDIIVTPGGEDPDREESAKNLSIVVDDMNKKRKQREILGLGFKHLPSYFTAVLKARWDSEVGTTGDYIFDIIHPEYVVVDHTATSKNPEDMSFIAQCVPKTVKELVMMFPKKEKQLYDLLQKNGIMVGSIPDWKDMATEVKMWEVWFDWYKKKGSSETKTKTEMDQSIFEPGITWEKISGVLWKYDTLILDKMLDPNFDHEGEEKLFSYANPGDETTKTEVQPQQMIMSALTGQTPPNLTKERIYHNYFQKPRKPYYFFGYDQWGKVAYDETSRIEQNIRNQENLDDQNKTILDQLKTRVKHIWSKDSGMGAKDVQRLDMDNPKMDALVEGNPNNVHAEVRPERPDSAQFNALNDTRSRMYAISGSTAVRGQLQSDTATSNQIAREADFTRTDDLVEDTINAACEWMAEWQMQFIKLRYTQEHMREILGTKGQVTYVRIRRDDISDGMEVMIKSSSTDKLKAQRNAMDTAKLGPPYSNALDFFTDMGMSDPEGRTERGYMAALDPQGYVAKYVMHMDIPQQVNTLNAASGVSGQPPPPQPGAPAPQVNAAPQAPTPGNTSQIAATPAPMPQASPRTM